ncbi:LOW QUALITY PROTEIN: transcriptional regulator ATRX-like [Palaemon carinicauda]|uniref:LOW QUALITY PROTEIN: transcriptional regulator ATRX-like n=1 Tax=Palaemon carinicauda TaxID=392227 RepID=UPI0035B5FF85
MSSAKMEPDPDGLSQQVAVIMTGKVYREAGLKHSKHPEVEGLLYDRLCQIGKHKLRDDVRRMALSIAIGVRDKEFQPTVAWLDNFMRRFCLSKKKMGFHSVAMLKTKAAQNTTPTETASNEKVTQEEVFSALGFPKDFTGFGENLEQGMENGSSTGSAAGGKTSGAENGISEPNAKQDGGASETGDPLVSSDPETSALNSTNDKPSNSVDKASSEVEEVDPLQIENKDEDMEVDPLGGDKESKAEEDDVGRGDKNKKNEDVNEKQKGKNTDVDTKDKTKGDNEEKDTGEEVELMSASSSNPKEEDEGDGATSNGSDESEDESEKDKGKKPKVKEGPENDEEKKTRAEDECILYTKEENRYFKKNIENLQKRLTLSVVRCCSCFEQVNHQLPTLVFTHPVLGIFICKRCRKYYGKGKYHKDDDGYDEYCRLCAEGGDLLCCEQEGCYNGFCKRCIKRVMGRTELRNAEKAKNWACYVCNKEPMMELRALHRAILQNLKDEEVKKSNLSRKELHSKEIKNKFALLKKTMVEKKQKQVVVKEENASASREESWLRDVINNLSEMLQICFSNVEKIESVWVKHKYSEEATKKTASRLIKQLDAMQQNFLLMKEDVVLHGGESSINESMNESVEGGSSDSKEVTESKSKDGASKVGDQFECIEKEGDIGKSADGSKKKEKSRNKKNESEETEDSPKESKAESGPNAEGNKEALKEEESPPDTEEGVGGSDEGNSNEATSLEKKRGRGRPRKPVSDGRIGKYREEESTDKDDKVDDKDDKVDDKDDKVDDKDEKVDEKVNDKDEKVDEKVNDKDEKVDDTDEKVDDIDETPRRRGRPKKSASLESKSTEEEETSNGDERTSRSKLRKLDKDDDKGKDTNNSVQSSEDVPKRRGRSKKLVENPADGEKEKDDTPRRRGRPRKSLPGEELEVSEPMSKEDNGDEANDDASSTEVCDDIDESNIPASSNEMDDDNGDADEEEEDGKEEKCESPNVKDVKKKSTGKVGEDVVKTPKKGVEDSDEDDKSKGTKEKSVVNKEIRSSPRKGKNKEDDDGDGNAKESEEKKSSDETKEKAEGKKSPRKGKKKDKDDDSEESAKESEEDKKNKDTKEKAEGKKSPRKGKKKGKDDDGEDSEKESEEDKKNEDTKEKVEGKKSPKKGKKKGKDNDSGDSEKESEEDKKNEDTKEKAVGIKSPKKGKKNVNDDDSGDSATEEVTENGKMKKGSKLSLAKKTTVEETESDSCDEKESKNEEKIDKGKKGKKSGKVKKEEEEDGETKVKKEKSGKEAVDKKDGKKKRKRKDSGGSVTPEEVLLKRSKKKSEDSGSESVDSLLGIGSDDSDDNNKRKKKRDSGDDSYMKQKRRKSNLKKLSKTERELKKKNKAALSSLLNSNSEEDSDSEGGEVKEKGKVKKGKAKKNKESGGESSDTDISVDGFRKKGKNKGKKSGLNDNEKAKDALLESESSDNLDEKPKPKCKKKVKPSKGPRSADEARRHRLRSLRAKLSEEEREKLEKQQLDGKAVVPVEPIDSDLLTALEEGGFVDITEYPDLVAKLEQDQDTYDGDAEEEDSDREFSKLMKFDVNTKFCKPGPKSKKKFLLPDNDDDEDQDTSTENEESNGSSEQKGNEPKGKKPPKKKEGLLDIDIDQDQDQDEDEVEEESFSKKKKKGGITLNEKLKKNLLLSSDEEDEEEEEEEDNEEEKMAEREMEEREKIKHEMKKLKKKKKKGDDDDDEEEEEPQKVTKKGYMKLDITSDEDDDDFKPEKDDGDNEDDEEEDDDADSDFEESPRKRRTFQLSSSDSDSSTGKKKKKRKKDDDSDYEGYRDDSPSKHKKIRRVIRDEDLMESTKNATQEEEERRKRIIERQKQFNQIFEIDVESDQKEMGKLVLDFDPDTKKELVCVHEKLVKFLKPHQVKGVKFMWDSTIESLEMLERKAGSGCILAHCMGLGVKLSCAYFQVITYIHTLLTNKKSSRTISRVMVCCPVNTVYNWVSEFSNWLKGKLMPFEVWELVSAKDLWGRAYRLDDWWKEGGVCVMGYDMFRNLSNPKNKRYKGKMKEIFSKTLVDPGPDVMVCDEGHLLKNEKTALSKAINKIRTSRRIILTGTPLQNNLKEYHCMIQFVKPNLLGTKKEFMNRFVNPIELGQCAEAEQRDVRRMKRRAHILHNLLEGCVQRFDYTVLKPFLPPKFEYVISIQLSEIQVALYRYYLENLAQGGPKRQGSGLFVDFGALSRVWTHPKVLEFAVRRALLQDDEEDLEDFICDDTTTDESSDDERSKKKRGRKKKKDEEEEDDDVIEEEEVNEEEAGEPGRDGTKMNSKKAENGADGSKMNSKKAQNGPLPGLTASGKVRVDWWKKVVIDKVGEKFEEEDYLDRIEHSGKLILLLDILRESCSIGDKVLVFSQSLLALDMIEDFLEMIDRGELEMPEPEEQEGQEPLPMPFKKWRKERDYLRLDGSTNAESRKFMCKTFNNVSNERCRLFLISTRAGGLGINLVAANRVVIFDSSWNPSHDSQSIFRVYRFGQKKPCYVYRFVAQGTMEEKIYSRQVTKMSTALRVVDEHQIKRYFKMADLQQLYEFTPAEKDARETPAVPDDRLLAELLKRQKDWIVNYHEHDSLLENQTGEELSEEERKAAWEDYENEKKGFLIQNQRNTVMPVVGAMGLAAGMHTQHGMPSLSMAPFSFEGVVNTIKAQNPHLSQNELCESVVLATKQIQRIHLNHYQRVQGMVYNLKNPMIAPEQRKLLPFGNHPEMLPLLEQQLRLLEDNIQRENQVINHMTQITPQRKDAYANMLAAGLVRGQPTTKTEKSFSADYVERSTSAASTSTIGVSAASSSTNQQNPTPKKVGTGDVILID